jgi:acetoin utilization deacetylase AcuC-like enzyme
MPWAHALEPIPFEPADERWIRLLHDDAYVDRVRDACARGVPWIDVPDSAICPASYEVARLAVGGVLAACDRVMADDPPRVFCAVRPPGHHAEADRSMGFCLFNNVAIGAAYLRERHGLDRVAVVDFDVHHGNGTQHLFEEEMSVFFVSLHEDPSVLYPGTGYAHERGRGAGLGFTLNCPMSSGSGDREYVDVMMSRVIPALEHFEPQMLLISAGFDAAAGDPLANQDVSVNGFAALTRLLVRLAERFTGGRIVSVLEGGYDLHRLGDYAAAHVAELLADPSSDPAVDDRP